MSLFADNSYLACGESEQRNYDLKSHYDIPNYLRQKVKIMIAYKTSKLRQILMRRKVEIIF